MVYYIHLPNIHNARVDGSSRPVALHVLIPLVVQHHDIDDESPLNSQTSFNSHRKVHV